MIIPSRTLHSIISLHHATTPRRCILVAFVFVSITFASVKNPCKPLFSDNVSTTLASLTKEAIDRQSAYNILFFDSIWTL